MRKTLIALMILAPALAKDEAPIPAGSFPDAVQPSLCTAPDGTAWLAFASPAGEVQVACLKPGDKAFSKPMPVTKEPDLALGMRRGPRIAVTDHGLALTFIAHNNLVCWRSADAGRTWQGPVRVNAEDGSCEEGLQALAFTSLGGGRLLAVWMDHGKARAGSEGQDLLWAVSKDGGKTFSKPAVVYASPSGSVCTCCHPSLASGPDGSLWALWRNDLEGARDMYVAAWHPKAEGFSKAEKLGEGTWKINACPMDGGGIAVGKDGKLVAAWRREGRLFATLGDPAKEIPLGRGKDPAIAVGSSGPLTLWTNLGAVYARRPGAEGEGVRLADPAPGVEQSCPVLAALPSGGFVAAWEEKAPHDGTASIKTLRLP